MKIYIGFSVDMDRAYSNFNNHGNLISKYNEHYAKYNYYKDNFIENTYKLLKYFKNKNYNKSVTWFVNESDYNITILHKKIFEKCIKSGEIGLHTHLNSHKFNAQSYNMSNNRNDWEKMGIILPNKRISEKLNNSIKL